MAKVPKLQNSSVIKFSGPVGYKMDYFCCNLNKRYGLFAAKWTASKTDFYNGLYVIDLDTNTERLLEGFSTTIESIICSKDNKTILCSSSQDDTIINLETGQEKRVKKKPIEPTYVKNAAIKNAAFFHNEDKLIAYQNGMFYLYSSSMEIERSIKKNVFNQPQIVILANDKYMVFTTYKEIILLEVETGKEINKYLSQVDTITAINISPNEKLLLYAGCGVSSSNDRELVYPIYLLDLETGKIIYQTIIYKHVIVYLEFSSNGRYVVVTTADKVISYLDIKNGNILQSFQGHRLAPWKAIFSDDNQQVISISPDKTIRRWNINF